VFESFSLAKVYIDKPILNLIVRYLRSLGYLGVLDNVFGEACPTIFTSGSSGILACILLFINS
jgi:hypothetical protein